jgi:hypothetical protein
MKIFILIFLLIIATELSAQVRFDTVNVKHVGVGIIHTEIHEGSNPWTIDVLEIDLSNSYNKIESVKSQNKLLGNQTVSQMAILRDSSGHTVVGAINGDFYASGGIPIGKQIINGQMLKQNSYYSSFGISKDNKPSLGLSNYNGVLFTNNSSHNVHDVNNIRKENYLVLYNSYYGNTTGSNQFGTEINLRPLTEWIVNDTVYCIVEDVEFNVGNMSISNGNAVLSGHGTSAQFLTDNVIAGDTVKLLLEFTSMRPKLNQLIGGYPKIINNGSNYVQQGYNQEGGPPHTFERHPRTAIGFSEDSTKVYFITVDGRGYSVGMTLNELADFMIEIGVHHGLNLDGGGSTTMWVRNKIVNNPSDGIERAVGNGMLVYSTAPKVDSVSNIFISPSNLRLFKGDRITFSAEGYDKYFNPLEIDPEELTYSVSEEIGIIDSNGLFTASENIGSGVVIADYNEIKDTCFVYIKTIGEISLKPKRIVTNTLDSVEFTQTSKDEDGIPKNLDNTNFNWRVSDTTVAKISINGIFQGKSEGTTYVILQYENLSDSAFVTVQNIEGELLLNSLDSEEDFALIGTNLDLSNSYLETTDELKTEGESSLKVIYEYMGNSSKVYNVHLQTNLEIEGVPDSIKIDLMTNGAKNQVIYFFKDDNFEDFQINVKKWAEVSNFLDVQPGAFSNISTTEQGSIFNFPVTLTGIQIKLDAPRENGVVYRDSLILDNLRISYPDITTDIRELDLVPNQMKLYQNYPNPFNPITTIKYSVPNFVNSPFSAAINIELSIYDILGRKVKTLVNKIMKPGNYEVSFDASDLSSGVYFYKLQSDGFLETKRMLLLK